MGESVRIPEFPPVIAALEETEDQPLWSVMIPVYNCSIFLPETLWSVLRQDPGVDKMQIEVVDDASTDANVEQLVKEIGKGRILYYKQPENRGSLRNFETCINRAKGHYVHLLHGDDMVKPGFYTAMESLFHQSPEAGAAFCRYDYINHEGVVLSEREPQSSRPGVLPDIVERLTVRQCIQYAAMVVKRSVYESLGAFYLTTYGEDWEMWVRIACNFPVAYTPENLASYRVHELSISGNRLWTGEHLEDIDKVFRAIAKMVDPTGELRVIVRLKRNYANWTVSMIEKHWDKYRDKPVARAHIFKLKAFYKDYRLLFRIQKLKLRMMVPGRPVPVVHVRDYQLADQLPQAARLKEDQVFYILWWKEVPVGEMYVEDWMKLDDSGFLVRIFETLEKFMLSTFPADGQSEFYNAWKKNNAADLKSLLDKRLPAQELLAGGELAISLIICTHNRPGRLKKCLEHILRMKYPVKQVLVVDNAPNTLHTKVVVDAFPGIQYVAEPRKGLDIARNTGIASATEDIIAFLDDDVRVGKNWSLQVWEAFRDPEIDALTGLVLPEFLDTESQQLFEQNWPLNKGYTSRLYTKEFLLSNKKYGAPVWDIGAGANMAFRKKAFALCGNFDERLDAGAAGCNGDSEQWFRLLLSGQNIIYWPQAYVYHLHRSEKHQLNWQVYNYIRGHVVAALVQHRLAPHLGYRRRVFIQLPLYYISILVKGFPYYKGRYSTVFKEIRGILSGIKFYRKVRNKPART